MPARVRKKKEQVERMRWEIAGIAVVSLALFILISLHAQTGLLGKLMISLMVFLAGNYGIYVLIAALAYFGGSLCWTRRRLELDRRSIGIILLTLILLTALHLFSAGFLHHLRGEVMSALWQTGMTGRGGGLVGALFGVVLIYLFAGTGTIIILIALSGIDLVLLTGLPLRSIFRGCGRGLQRGGRAVGSRLTDFLFEEVNEGGSDSDARPQQVKTGLAASVPVIINCEPSESNSGRQAAEREDEERQEVAVMAEEEREKGKPGTASSTPQEYTPPPLSLLARPLKVKSTRMNKEIIENVRILEETLESFGVKVCVNQVHLGPAITRYEVQPAPGIKVSKIVNLADNIALSMAAQDVRIEAPIPGKAALGIEVPNKEITPVYLRDILEGSEFQEASSSLTVALGKDIAGSPIITDLSKMPHLLLAGATGSGKSVCLNTLICSILFKAAPDEVKFLLIDPKKVELTTYNGIPHLISPVVTDPRKAASALKWAVSEMENRYELFASLGVRDIGRYNQLGESGNKEYRPLPYMVVVIDELADLMMVAPVEIEDAICRLAQMARAAGIHLVVATQRPSVDVITGVIKANIPSRIAFAVSSQIDSRTILDMNGAEKLLGKGDMLFLPVGAIKPIRVQGALVTEKEVEDVVAFIARQGNPTYLEEFPGRSETEAQPEDLGDPLFRDAAKLVIEMGHGSVSLIQRRFRVGYSRAARIVDLLEEKGVVGPYEGAKPRSVLMTMEQFQRYYGK